MSFNLKNKGLIFLVAVFLIYPISLGNFALPAEAQDSPDYIDGEVLVKFKEEAIDLETKAGQAEAEILIEGAELAEKEEIVESNIAVLEITDNSTVEETIADLENNPSVEFAEPNYIRHIATISTNDVHKDLLWALDNIGQGVNGAVGTADADMDMPEAWAINEGTNSTVIVAVIDSGVFYTHPDLASNMWDGANCVDVNGEVLGSCIHGYDFVNNILDPTPTLSSHGTHIAGVVGAAKNNNEGVVGVAPNVKIMALKVDVTVNSFSTSAIVSAINFARENGAKVINASFGGEGFSQIEYDAIAEFAAAGGILVAAAGNSTIDNDGDNAFYPASYDLPNIISVAATDSSDTLASFSNFGASSVDVGAPGKNIYSATMDGSYTYLSGTSMAAPHVAGLAALLWGYQPAFTPTEIKTAILNNGDTLPSLQALTVTGKRINAFSTLNNLLASPPPAPDTTPPVITLLGTNPLPVTVGETFADPGARASDDVDGDITASIIVGGDVIDINTAGTYTITYNVTDAAGNHATEVTRTVIMSPGKSSGGNGDGGSTSSGGGGGGGGGSRRPLAKAAETVGVPLGCTSSTLFSPLTGVRCPVAASVPGCLPGNLFSPLTGEKCPASTLPSVLGVSKYNFTLLLQAGSRGAEVMELQKLLNQKMYACGTPDGSFGQGTKACVIKFQIANNLPPVGIVGPLTRTALNR